jgi:ATP/maltotriose-dependent transcriptional regulator MalT
MVPWELDYQARLAELTGEPGDALESGAAAVSLTEDSGNIVIQIIAQHGLGVAEQLAGRPERAEAVLTKVLAQARAHRTGLFDEGYLLARLATARLAQGDIAGARSLADEAVELTRRQGAPVVECFALLIRARVLRASGEAAQAAAMADVDAGLALAAQVGAVAYAVFLEEEQARLLHDGDRLAAVLHRYRDIGATGHARRLENELALAADDQPAG